MLGGGHGSCQPEDLVRTRERDRLLHQQGRSLDRSLGDGPVWMFARVDRLVGWIGELVDDPVPRHCRLPSHDELPVDRKRLGDSRAQPEQLVCFGVSRPCALRRAVSTPSKRDFGRRACVDDAQPVLACSELNQGPPEDRMGQRDVDVAGCGREAGRDLLRRRPAISTRSTHCAQTTDTCLWYCLSRTHSVYLVGTSEAHGWEGWQRCWIDEMWLTCFL